MTYKSLYRTYRPHSFDTVVGQKHIIQTLQNAIKADKLSHAYLFCGPRGTGKTTVAKLLAKSVNCLNPKEAPCNRCEHCTSIQHGTHPDVIEIDAASNNGVDEIRDLIEKVKYAPIQGKYKVYIVDEVHMLSQGAFNALLKTLEEPPAHVIFILATTEPHKVLATIISRCQRYDFVRVNHRDIQARVEEVLTQEKIQFDSEATRLISQLADGGVRDALSILEQVIAYSGDQLTAEHVNDIYGIATTQDKLRLLDAVLDQNVAQLMVEIETITKKNVDIRRLTNDLMELLKEAIVFAYTADERLLARLNSEEADRLNRVPPILILSMIEDLMETAEKFRSASNIHAYFEIGLLKLVSRVAEGAATLSQRNQVYEKQVTPAQKAIQTVERVERVDETVQQTPHRPSELSTVKATEDKPVLVESVPLEDNQAVDSNESRLNLDNAPALEDDFLLGLLRAADKPYRIKLNESWESIQAYKTDPKYAALAHMLMQSKPVAASPDFVLVAVRADAYAAEEMNQSDKSEGYAQLLEQVFGQSMRLYAIDEARSAHLVSTYMDLVTKNKPPEAVKVPKVTKKQRAKAVVNAEQEVIDLFGLDNVEIV
jgi:DNA polymerase-3 subunit gamma/tau